MGALHEGHLSLIRRARKLAGEDGVIVVSVYVNPTQFNDPKDLKGIRARWRPIKNCVVPRAWTRCLRRDVISGWDECGNWGERFSPPV